MESRSNLRYITSQGIRMLPQ